MRTSGVLLSVTSLPSKYGIGCFDQAAYDFVDWLEKAGQTYWQILPLGATSHAGAFDSPYQAYSAFAGNPYFWICSTERMSAARSIRMCSIRSSAGKTSGGWMTMPCLCL